MRSHIFIADSLQLTNLTSRFGAAEGSISLEKLDCSVSRSCPSFIVNFSGTVAACQPYFVNILIIENNIKDGLKSFLLQNAKFSSYKAF